MQLARVRGNVVASIKDAELACHRLLLVEPVSAAVPNQPVDDAAPVLVAIDLIGAGMDEIVLVARGSAARIAAGTGQIPTDAAIVAIVDSVQFDRQTTFVKH